jgi:hypothetical protein
MGRTLPSITQVFLGEQEAFGRFRRALRRTDQLALDDLFVSAQKHLAAAAYAAHALPFETFLLAMLLEEHKEMLRMRRLLESSGLIPPEPPDPATADAVDLIMVDPEEDAPSKNGETPPFLGGVS